jgi:Gluconate 2-dehydrogenase subunit 3
MSGKDKDAPSDIARREMLKRVGVAGAVAAAPATELSKPAHAQPKPAATPLREALETLTAAADVLEAMVARIVPTDENGPGAAEARAAHYIDRALTGPLASSKAAYVSGLAALDAYAQSSKGAPFTKLIALGGAAGAAVEVNNGLGVTTDAALHWTEIPVPFCWFST